MNCLPGFKLKFGNPLSQFLGFIGEGLDGVLSFLLKGSGPRKGWQPSFLLYALNIFAEPCKQMGHPECTHINLGWSSFPWFCLQHLQSLDRLCVVSRYFCNAALSLVRYRKSSSLAEKLEFWPSALTIHLAAAPCSSPHSVYHSVPPALLFTSQFEQHGLRCSVSQRNHC